jgi:hypothetical protein
VREAVEKHKAKSDNETELLKNETELLKKGTELLKKGTKCKLHKRR